MRSCLRECRFTQRDLIIKPLILSYKGKTPWWCSKPQPTIPAAYPLLDIEHILNKIFTYKKTCTHFSHCLPISLDNSCYRSVRITKIFLFIWCQHCIILAEWPSPVFRPPCLLTHTFAHSLINVGLRPGLCNSHSKTLSSCCNPVWHFQTFSFLPVFSKCDVAHNGQTIQFTGHVSVV